MTATSADHRYGTHASERVTDGSLRAKEIVAAILIAIMALGPLAVTAYQNPYTGRIVATPNLPGK